MNTGRFVLTVLAATVGTSLTDWLFFGVLFHDRYLAYPEVGEARLENQKQQGSHFRPC